MNNPYLPGAATIPPDTAPDFKDLDHKKLKSMYKASRLLKLASFYWTFVTSLVILVFVYFGFHALASAEWTFFLVLVIAAPLLCAIPYIPLHFLNTRTSVGRVVIIITAVLTILSVPIGFLFSICMFVGTSHPELWGDDRLTHEQLKEYVKRHK